MGVFLLGHLGCYAPLVVAYPTPRDPITSVDVLEPGETEFSASVVNAVVLNGGQFEIAPWDSTGSDWFETPYKASLAHSFGRVELRALGTRNFQGWMWGGGVGVPLQPLGGWTPILEGGYAHQRVSASYSVPEEYGDTGEVVVPASRESYAYKVHAPYARVRMVRSLGPRFRMPVALKVNHSMTQERYGVAGAMPRETYSTLAAGLIFDPGPGCLSFGLGAMVRLEEPGFPTIEAAASCALGGQP